MGMEQSVVYPGTSPAWAAARDLLEARGYPVRVLMIDSLPALPGEQPPEAWHELRLGTPQGMVTVRREVDRLVFVTWGNADAGLRQAWNALAWAFAEAGGGEVETPGATFPAEEFRRRAELPPGVS
jgi:hypothetical protein